MLAWVVAAGFGSVASAQARGVAEDAGKWPQNVDLYAMLDQDGAPVLDKTVLASSFRQLVMELGTMVSNKPNLPADTVGLYGFDIDIATQFALTEAHYRAGETSPWARAEVDERAPPYHVVPTVTVRKGLPLSTEVGASVGWISGTSTGTFGGFARVAVLEGYKPLPDVALKLGYAGYVGNPQLDCGALDLGVTVGSTYPIGRLPGINEVEPAPPIALPEFGAGLQFVVGTAHLSFGGAWAPATIPTVTTSFGFTY